MFISGIGLQFYVFVAFLSSFRIRVMVASQNEFGILQSSVIFQKSLSSIGVMLSLNSWENSPVKPSSLAFLCWKSFYYSFDFCSSDWSVENFCFSLVQFGRLYFLKNLSISSKLSLAYNCSQQSHDFLYFCVVYCDLSIVISNFTDFILLPFFFLVSLAKIFVYSIYLLKKISFQ